MSVLSAIRTWRGKLFHDFARDYLHSFSCCCLLNLRNHAKFREKNRLMAVQGHPRSSILVPIESAYGTSYWSFIVTMDGFRTVFEIVTNKATKLLVFLLLPCFTPPIGGPIRISGWNLPHKNERGGAMVKIQPFLTDPPVWQTDGRALKMCYYRPYASSFTKVH